MKITNDMELLLSLSLDLGAPKEVRSWIGKKVKGESFLTSLQNLNLEAF